MFDEILAQRSQQFFVRGGIRRAQIVHRVDQSAAHEVGPDAIDDRSREHRVVPAGEPFREDDAPVLRGIDRDTGGIERRGRQRTSQFRIKDVARGFREYDVLARHAAILDAHAGEQVRHLVILNLRPFFQRMIVAARARDALAQERLGRVFAQLDRVLVQDEIVQRAVLARAARA